MLLKLKRARSGLVLMIICQPAWWQHVMDLHRLIKTVSYPLNSYSFDSYSLDFYPDHVEDYMAQLASSFFLLYHLLSLFVYLNLNSL